MRTRRTGSVAQGGRGSSDTKTQEHRSSHIGIRPICRSRPHRHAIAVIKLMNQIEHEIAREHGADVLDQEMLRELAPYDGDGLHSRPPCNFSIHIRT